MCPAITSPPSPFTPIFTGAALRGWFLLGVCVLLCVAIIRTGSRFDNVRSIALGCILVLSFGVGMFIALGVADTWSQNLLVWYGKNVDALGAHNCPIEGVRTQYLRLDAQQRRLESLGFALFVGVFIIVVVVNKLGTWKQRSIEVAQS